MAKERFRRPSLPDEDDPKFFDLAVDACILAFNKLQDAGMALDYIGIKGKLRPIIMKDERFVRTTRMMKAELYMEEIEDAMDMVDELDHEEDITNGTYDIRNLDSKDAAALAKDQKDRFAQRMKLKDRLSELRSISKEKETEEVDALNIFFISLTPEEFAKMQNVEVHEGHDADNSLKADKKKEELVKAAQEHEATEDVPPFREDSEGNLVALQ
jgi:hypothetical protein